MSDREVNAVILHEDGNAEIKYVNPYWTNVKDIIGGYLEGLSPVDTDGQYGPWRGYCDEEGKLKGRPINVAANTILTALGWYGAGTDIVVGTVILMGEEDETGEAVDVPDATLKFVLDFYRENGEVVLD